ncbi:sterol desaturase family protein [Chitinophaga pendula]|uniref:sterol desaturase family protein n=1 Tax=Chitinophaga TaxID=79328 RepID=UPI000BAE7F29|nr:MULTISPECIES: sterol desaturase family protein [Chitinophaga]ASZ14109.1 sterol desaturase [Chitinophaga sp. MD30]UCJ08256.1 sterol desaturase family protein [Chitinophaga pendula]
MEQTIYIIAKIYGISTLRYFIIAGVFFAVFYLFFPKQLQHFKIQQRLAGSKDFLREILHSLQTTLVLSVLAFIVLFTPFKQYTQVYDQLGDYPVWYLGLSVVLSLIVHDTYFYWMHRALHHPRLFRLTHLVHHQSTNPSPWTSYSFHLLEAFTEGAVLFLIVLILPMHPLGIVLFTIAGFVINVYGHLGYEIAPRWFRKSPLFELFNTSVHHNLHHSKFKGNYGLYFRVWDRLMGTEHPDYVKAYDEVQARRFGPKAPAAATLAQMPR